MKYELYAGLMTGTSMDGVDGTLAAFTPEGAYIETLATASFAYPDTLREAFMQLQQPAPDEISREAQSGNALAKVYAQCVRELLLKASVAKDKVRAIGAHGQTIRHRPDMGYTRQSGNMALLAELTDIDVIGDFRSRDVAAGGQGAPLVPACHAALFGASDTVRVLVNIGGISNISILRPGNVLGFDTGPGNVLLDAWAERYLHTRYDENGNWAATGTIIPELLHRFKNESFFDTLPPKSTGRDLFNVRWLGAKLHGLTGWSAPDVQATLLALTADTIVNEIAMHAADATQVYVCGGGAANATLMQALTQRMTAVSPACSVATTEALGVHPQQVESLAFAWLAQRFVTRQAGNLPQVTGAQAPRILGALYPA